ncbi:hypothetical protein FRX31_031612 [Thalictrum thalictroides]|uniref:Uncharacterized protein n=1 Tax=Thalictrum thalictroides TaxID=46969 RepID=A0A7J6V3H3_THATH|nr:hypothetical protein FRX31_031612 [Thalictrum thalictroides]
MDLQINALKAWKDEILVVLHSEFALDLSRAVESAEIWNIISLSGGGMYLSKKSSWWEKGRLTRGPWLSINQRLVIGGREMHSTFFSFIMEISDQELMKCQNDVPSTTE